MNVSLSAYTNNYYNMTFIIRDIFSKGITVVQIFASDKIYMVS